MNSGDLCIAENAHRAGPKVSGATTRDPGDGTDKAVDERLNTIIRLTNADGEAITKADADKAEAEPNPDAVTESQPLKNEPSIRDLIEAERQSRKADMKRLKYMEAKTRRSIAELDMMGEYGSKVGCLLQ